MKKCLYCNREKEEADFSVEHVIPQGLGGNFTPVNPFKTNGVCARCNNIAGLFIDTAVIKNWFHINAGVEHALRFVKFGPRAIFPLRYMGPLQETLLEGYVCEMWLGPCGDSIYHFHKPYPEVPDMPVIVGPMPASRPFIDPGFIFVYIVPSNPAWWMPILLSCAANFPRATYYLGNGNTPPGGLYSNIPDHLRALHGMLEKRRDATHAIRLTLSIDFDTRFLAKLALGIGHLFLDSAFAESGDADLLREMMWEKDSKKRESIPVHGGGAFSEGLPAELFSWESGHVLALLPTSKGIALNIRLFNRHSGTILVSSTAQHWHGMLPETGMVFVMSPGLQRCIGPLQLAEFVAHRQGIQPNADLAALETESRNIPEFPPRDLPEQ